jgi:hypothetical protein
VHSGFERPTNDVAFTNMSSGWKVCVSRMDAVVDDQD